MVCIPCIVIPFLLWVFHKYIQPIVAKFLPWTSKKGVEDNTKSKDVKVLEKDEQVTQNGSSQNGELKTPNGTKAETVGGDSKKDN